MKVPTKLNNRLDLEILYCGTLNPKERGVFHSQELQMYKKREENS